MFLIREQHLQERLEDFQQRCISESSMRTSAQEQCRELLSSLARSENHREALEAALDEARHCQHETNTELVAEKSRHAATHSELEKLYSENRTLWNLVDDLTSVPGGDGKQVSTVQELHNDNQEQKAIICKQTDEIETLRATNAAMKERCGGCNGCQDVTDIEDDSEDAVF
ncbi:hypothetical protein I7I51_09019 [Histoplasma capsulatum]|uniref:Uncharacterized protein n=1 Tax=Ajellomyces capsulatus TaxID=5037 RepID=A0A8A1M4B1_AJECA|nr:hypothetical protein I7I51_09019 [Histoplasma capsulatum]